MARSGVDWRKGHCQWPSGVSTTAVRAQSAAAPAATHDAPAPHGERHFTAREALHTRAFWLLGLGHGFALLVVTAVNVHAISHMKEGLGYSLAQASLVIMVMTVAQAAGLLLGAAKDTGANLLIAGAFGHPRLQEFIFGGTTRTLLNSDGPSLFLSH